MYYTKKNTFHNIITLAAEFTKCFFFPHTYLLFYTVHIDEGSTVEH